jgi:hypothetical protein
MPDRRPWIAGDGASLIAEPTLVPDRDTEPAFAPGRSLAMGWHNLALAAALTALVFATGGPLHGHTAWAAIMPAQLMPAPNQDAGPDSQHDPEEGDSEDDDEEQGSSRSEDLQDGILRLPRTGDDEAVKVPPAERLPPSPSEKPKRE